MWDLQRDLERHPQVGVVLSLPLIMAEGKQAAGPLRLLFSHKKLLSMMEDPKHGSVTRRFVSEDRRRASFLLRMKESVKKHDRLAVVQEIEDIVRAHGFQVQAASGLYLQQGKLASLVGSSLVTGIGQLLFSFLLVAVAVSRSLRSSVALLLTLCLVPAFVLGLIGHLKIPVDIISAPAVNIALGMAIDDMLHMTALARTFRRRGAGRWEAWARARAVQWKPLLGTMATVSAGFAIFALSSFPPTRRFGMAIVGGALIDVLACLVVLPLLAGAEWPRRLRVSALRSRFDGLP